MLRRKAVFSVAGLAILAAAAVAQMTPWLQWSFLPPKILDEIVGESSGENAWNAIMETGGYDKDRPASEYGPTSLFHETKFYVDKLKEYNIPGVDVVRFPGGKTWDGVKGELWEVEPIRQKLASYRDMAAMLATGSENADVTAELIWVGQGTKEDLEGKDVKDKIVVTDGPAGRVSSLACGDKGAVGVISMNSSRPYFDPLQLPWGSVRTKFAFQIPPRDGDYLKRRLLAGQKIKVHAEVVSEQVQADTQEVVCHIPGTDPNAGEVIFSAHLFEGYVKQGGNDDISGCAALMETARVLNTLITENRIPRPKRTIRFLMGPEISGTGLWVKANQPLMEKTLCNINLDMVGEWLSRNQSFFCLMRTTYGNPHYVNDVVENYYRYIGESNREHVQNRSNFYPVPRRIVAPTGADEPFYYSIETHYGSSDHEVFNDWGVRVPGIMMIAWPDRWYHTSGDHVDKADPTQMKRVAIIAAASAYTIASADDDMAVKIAGEITSNAGARIGHQLVRGLQELNDATPETLAEAYRTARAYVTSAVTNEKETLATVDQLATDKKAVGEYVATVQKSVDEIGKAQLATLDAHMKAVAKKLGSQPVTLQMTELEKTASKIVPRPTAKVKENGYRGYNDYITKVPREVREKYPVKTRNTGELQLLINGKHSALEIKEMLDTENPAKTDLQDVLNYLEVLKAAGLVEM
jgi:aminopeptidase YwaD